MISGLGMIPRLATSEATKTQGTATSSHSQSIGASFGSMLDNTVGQLDAAEQVSIKALQGKADTREVVDTVMTAQQTLQTAIAIRDKIVSAYLDISRMSI